MGKGRLWSWHLPTLAHKPCKLLREGREKEDQKYLQGGVQEGGSGKLAFEGEEAVEHIPQISKDTVIGYG